MEENTVKALAWIILFAPFAASALILLFTLRSKAISGFLSVGSMIVVGVLSVGLLIDHEAYVYLDRVRDRIRELRADGAVASEEGELP